MTSTWDPFIVLPPGIRGPSSRSILSVEGIGDRLRSAAFAELQAIRAFTWAADTFTESSPAAKASWLFIANEEEKHFTWLTTRMKELSQEIKSRPVSADLYDSFKICKSGKDFALFMASAEARGQAAGFKFAKNLKTIDPVTSDIFFKIATEEEGHIAFALSHFGISQSELRL